MNRHNLISILGFLVFPTLVVAAPTDLARTVENFDRAQVGNDTKALTNLVAADYLLVNSNGTVENKDEYLADFHLPGFKIDPYALEQRTEKMWTDAALISGLLHLGWTQDGKHQNRLLRISYIWARREGRWQLTYTQVTRVTE